MTVVLLRGDGALRVCRGADLRRHRSDSGVGSAFTRQTGGITWNYTTFLNVTSCALAALMLVVFFRTGGREVIRHMGGGGHDPETQAADEHEEQTR